MKVEQIMTTNVKTCRMNDTLEHAAQIMWDYDCGIVPVVNDAMMPIATITDRDICMAGFLQGRPLREIPVGSAMSKQIVTVHRSEHLSAAESMMRAQQIRRLPVVGDDGAIVGILSLNDIAMRGHLKKGLSLRDELGPVAIAQTLSAICMRPSMVHAAEE